MLEKPAPMPPAGTEQVAAYHDRTKHRLDRYAAGPDTLDWSMQPNPFREFSGAPRIELPLGAQRLITHFSSIYQPGNLEPQPLTLQAVGALLELAMGLSAWKEYGPDRWALRCNPSSGNLHPTEAYLVCQNIPALENGLYHYVSRDHVLEQRCRFQDEPSEEDGRIFIGLSSIHWREAWKYGERAFRYCQLDVGHALGALRYAAGTLGWGIRLVESVSSRELSEWLGLDRNSDFEKAEREEADLLL
jgi:SagB-type dehydrogenase family enzyme